MISSDELIDYLAESEAQDWQGEMDYNDMKEIAGFSAFWELKEVSLDLFPDLLADPDIIDSSPIITFGSEMDWEIADGKHRVGAAKARGEKTIMAYVPIEAKEGRYASF